MQSGFEVKFWKIGKLYQVVSIELQKLGFGAGSLNEISHISQDFPLHLSHPFSVVWLVWLKDVGFTRLQGL